MKTEKIIEENQMPTAHYVAPKSDTKKSKKGERYIIGPNGEKRPAGAYASAIRAVEIITGIREEEYVEGVKPPKKKKKVRIL